MYSAAHYRTDLAKAWKPVRYSTVAFWKTLPKLDPFASFGPCFLMVARFMWLFFQFAFFTGRRLVNL